VKEKANNISGCGVAVRQIVSDGTCHEPKVPVEVGHRHGRQVESKELPCGQGDSLLVISKLFHCLGHIKHQKSIVTRARVRVIDGKMA
jgi:hypothetical protein